MRRIALLTWSDCWGGAETHMQGLARALQRRGHDVALTCLTSASHEVCARHCGTDPEPLYLPTPVHPQQMSLSGWLRFFSGHAQDVCVLVKNSFAAGDWRLDLAARIRCGSYLVIEHTLGQPVPPRDSRRHWKVLPGLGVWWYRERLRRYVRSLAPRKVICVSGAACARLAEYGFPARKLVIVQNGVDTDRFKPDQVVAENWRRQHGIPGDALVFGVLGRFDSNKGYDIALQAFELVLRQCPEANPWLVLVGAGPDEAALREQAERISPDGCIRFVPFTDRPWEALAAIDVFVVSSYSESMPLALLEAMAAGCRVVATAVGGIPEVLTRPELGSLVQAGDAQQLARALLEVAAMEPRRRAAGGELARMHVVANFNAATQFERLAVVIETAVTGRGNDA